MYPCAAKVKLKMLCYANILQQVFLHKVFGSEIDLDLDACLEMRDIVKVTSILLDSHLYKSFRKLF